MLIVAVLEVMWGWCGRESAETKWFHISGYNFTGKRLYRMIGNNDLLVTNACKECVKTASGKGISDPIWLKSNVEELIAKFRPEMFLICGRVPLNTWKLADIQLTTQRVIVMPHPAARMWTNEQMERVRWHIAHDTADLCFTFDDVQPLEMILT